MSKPKQIATFSLMTGVILVIILAMASVLSRAVETPASTPQVAATGSAIDGSQDRATPNPVPSGVKPLPEGASIAELSMAAPAPKELEGYRALPFSELAGYPYEVDDDFKPAKLGDGSMSTVPDEIMAFDQTKVAISGYMVPLSIEESRVTEFVVVKNQLLCCFGQFPKMNEWVFVEMPAAIDVRLDQPVTVTGILSVGEVMYEGQLTSLYRLKGDGIHDM